MSRSSPLSSGLFLLLILSALTGSSRGQLRAGFYSSTCPNAESIVSSVVSQAVKDDPENAAALLRLHFHDCAVRGCDGSVLIDSDDGQQENRASAHQGLRGFDVIDDAKAQLEDECPGVVSCADIVALAARDSVALSNGPRYEVLTGRRDGLFSSDSEATGMPDVKDSAEVLISKFAAMGLDAKDLVLLIGAHTVGTTACFFMDDRLYNFNGYGSSDPTINPQFLRKLQSMCPPNGDGGNRIAMDTDSERIFDTHLFDNMRNGFAVLGSDAAIYSHPPTRAIVDSYRGGSSFAADFAAAMVKMGNISLLTGSQGEIRQVCSSFNNF